MFITVIVCGEHQDPLGILFHTWQQTVQQPYIYEANAKPQPKEHYSHSYQQ